MTRPVVLIIADAPINRRFVSAMMEQTTYQVVGPLTALEALRHCSDAPPAVLLIDVQLRGLRPSEVCLLVRGRTKGRPVPALLFGATRLVNRELRATVGYADGYVRPDHVAAAAARVEAAVRHSTNEGDGQAEIVTYAGRHILAHFDRVEILVDGVMVDLTRRELALLRFLLTHANRVVGRDDLLRQVWHGMNDGRSRTVDVHVRRLRRKLGAANVQIQTVAGLGYRFNERADRVVAPRAARAKRSTATAGYRS